MNELLAQWLHVDPSEFDTLRVALAHGFGRGGVIALGAALVVAILLGLRGSRQLPWSRRGLLVALRFFGVATVFLIVLQPELRLLKTAQARTHIAILVDASRSMTVEDAPAGGTRWAQGSGFANQLAAALEQKIPLAATHVLTFDDTVTTAPEPGASPQFGSRTDVGGSLRQLGERFRGERMGAVIVVSDGADHGGLRRELLSQAEPPTLESLGDVPVYTALAGDPKRFKDVGIADLAVENFGFVHNPVTVEAEIEVIGYPGKTVTVTLASEQGVVSTQNVVVTGTSFRKKVSFSFTPRRTGTFVYSVKIPKYSGEAVKDNNQRDFAIKIIRDKIRVLHICGMPSWDERYLRGLLKNDPNVDLVSFFILRTPYDLQPYSNDAYSLIPFPTRELFLEALPTFDLVIFQDFAYRNYFGFEQHLYLSALRNFVVDRGGGFVMVGGEQSFGPGMYRNTPIEEILPVYVGGPQGTTDLAPFRARLTGDGARHPITTLDFDPKTNAEVWQQLPQLVGTNLVTAKSDSIVLATHPTRKAPDGSPRPVVAISRIGKGRSMAVTADTTWRWALGSVAEGGTAAPYQKFWQNSIRWLIKDPDLKQVRVTVGRDNVFAGESVQAQVSVVEGDWRPLKGAQVEVQAIGPGGQRIPVPKGTTGEAGEYRFEIKPTARGIWRVRATAYRGGQLLDRDQTVFAFDVADPELERAATDVAFLQDLAERGDGQLLPTDVAEAVRKIRVPPEAPVRIIGERRETLWNRWEPFLVALVLLGLEWFLRRRWGLL